MGVELPDGSLSVHAHNTYLQVIHDHGPYNRRCLSAAGNREPDTDVPVCTDTQADRQASGQGEAQGRLCGPARLAVFLAFAVAGLVEWLFHPCNPLGFTTMAVLAPLLTFRGKKKKRVNENEG